MVKFMARADAGADARVAGTGTGTTTTTLAEDAFNDAWASVLSGGTEDSQPMMPSTPPAEATPDMPAATVIMLPPTDVEPLPDVSGVEVEVLELPAEVVIDGGDTGEQSSQSSQSVPFVVPCDESASPEDPTMLAGDTAGDNDAELEAATEPTDDAGESPELSAAKIDYLTACLRFSAVETKLNRVTAEIVDLESQLEDANARKEELQELHEARHEDVNATYQVLAAKMPAEELARYEDEIESGAAVAAVGDVIKGAMASIGSAIRSTVSGIVEVMKTPAGQAALQAGAGGDTGGGPAPEDQTWKLIPTSSLDWLSVKGMGKKKIEALVSKCPTMEAFEAVRADFYNGGLKQIDGVGEELAGRLENYALEVLRKHWARVAAATEAAEAVAAATEAVAIIVDPVPVVPPPTIQTRENPVPHLLTDEVTTTGDAAPIDITPGESAALDAAPCIACGGTGKSSKGKKCRPCKGTGTTKAPDVDATDATPATPADATPESTPEASESPEATRDPSPAAPQKSPEEIANEEIAQLRERYAFIKASIADGSFQPDPALSDVSYYMERGAAEFREGVKVEECIYTASPKQDHWLAGFIMAENGDATGAAK